MGKRSIKIQLYSKDKTKEQILNRYGDYILDDLCISCTVKEDLNTTEYFLDANFILDNEGIYRYLEEDAILKVQMDYGEEIFSIVDVNKQTSKVAIFARQITITESLCTWLTDVRPENKNGKDALVHMGQQAEGKHNLEFDSDISLNNTAFYQNQTLYDAIHISDNCFLTRWSGEVRRRGYKIIINEKLGENNGVQIRSGKNLTGFEAVTNIDNIVTRIKPRGFNGITIEGYVDSPLINNYKYIRTQTIKYEKVKLKSDIQSEDGTIPEGYAEDFICDTLSQAQTKLTELALLEYMNRIDVLEATYAINFIELSRTEEYKNFAQAELVQLGDEVQVYEEKHNINITVRAVSRVYDVLSQRTIQIDLTNKPKEKGTVSDTVKEIGSKLDQIVENIGYMNVTYAKIKDLEATNIEVDNLQAEVASIGNLKADKADIGELNAEIASIKELKANKAEVDDLIADVADIKELKADKAEVGELNTDLANVKELIADKANIGDLNTTLGKIEILESTVADINTLVNGNLTSDNIQSLILTADKVTINDALIKDAHIESVSADKIYAGTINTNKVKLQSDDGSMILNGSLQQFKDENGVVRIQVGKDANGDFSFAIYDETGEGQLITHEGIQSSDAIKDGIIVDANVAEDANISGGKLNIASVITKINEDGSETLLASKIKLDGEGQTLDIAFDDLTTSVTETQETVVANTTSLKVAQGQIQTLISDSEIISGEMTTLKDDYSVITQTVNSNTSKIGSLESTVEEVTSKQTTVEQTLEGFTATISEINAAVTEIDEKQTILDLSVDGFKTEVRETYYSKSDTNNLLDDITSEAEGTKQRVTVAESSIKQLSDSISTLIVDKNGSSLMTQTSNGWVFNMSEISNAIENAAKELGELSGDVDEFGNTLSGIDGLINDLGQKTAYITMSTDDNGDPCIELGKESNDFKVRITNSAIEFMEGTNRIAYVNNQSLYIEKAVIKNELQIGENSGWVFAKRSNGNLGLRWKGSGN